MAQEKFAGENLMTRQVEVLERIANALDYIADAKRPFTPPLVPAPFAPFVIPTLPGATQTSDPLPAPAAIISSVPTSELTLVSRAPVVDEFSLPAAAAPTPDSRLQNENI